MYALIDGKKFYFDFNKNEYVPVVYHNKFMDYSLLDIVFINHIYTYIIFKFNYNYLKYVEYNHILYLLLRIIIVLIHQYVLLYQFHHLTLRYVLSYFL